MKRDKLVDLKYFSVVHETDDAYLICFDADKESVWLPKSQCQLDEDDNIATMKESLAIEKEIEEYAI